jgi:hypothetical protein
MAQFAAVLRSGPYSQLRLVLPSKTPAKGNNVSVSPMLRQLREILIRESANHGQTGAQGTIAF